MDIARMRFQSAKNPEESGTLALAADGTVRVEPSEQFVEALAGLEQRSVERSTRFGTVASIALIALGVAAAVAGWLAGRIGGKLRETLTNPRDVATAKLQYAADRGLRLEYRQAGGADVSMTWSPGEYNADEAEEFAAAFERLRSSVGKSG